MVLQFLPRLRCKSVAPLPATLLAVSQHWSWVWQMPAPLQVTNQLDRPWKIQQPGVETLRRRRCSLILFAGSSRTICQDRGSDDTARRLLRLRSMPLWEQFR
uniref:Putative secreted protein n=1 Tax=Ixodes ricinus TaxID=34613 RepID=A0A6B0UF83_IXORI